MGVIMHVTLKQKEKNYISEYIPLLLNVIQLDMCG